MKVYELMTLLGDMEAGKEVKIEIVLTVEDLKSLLAESKEEGWTTNSTTVSLSSAITNITDTELILETSTK